MKTLPLIIIMLIAMACNTKPTTSAETHDIKEKSSEYANSLKKHRDNFLKGFIMDKRSPIDSSDLANIHFFEGDEAYNVDCTYKVASELIAFDMATYSGKTKPYSVHGYLSCPIKGKEIELQLYQNRQMMNVPPYANHLFLPYKDLTNGEETYGGGRYIDVKASDIQNGKLTIDFNKSYNPWCAYSDGYNCPIPPLANHLEMALKVGESKYTGPKKQRPQ